MIVICQNDFPIGVLPGATEEQAEAFIKKMRADSDAAITDPRQVRPVFHWHDVPEMKACDLWRCTVCGRIGAVGRCCGEETREPYRPNKEHDAARANERGGDE